MPDEAASTATIEAPATDTSAAEVSTSPGEAAVESSAPSTADVYDTAFEEHLAGETGTPAPVAKDPAASPDTAAPTQETFLTDGDKQVLERSKIKPDQLKGLARESIDALVGTLREQQSVQDGLRSELGRYKPKDDAPAKQAESKQPVATDYSKRVDDTIAKIAASYDDEIKPMAGLFTDLHGEINQVRESTQAVPMMMELMQDLVIEGALSGLEKEFPSITSPESRQRVMDRLMTEWSTGAYIKPGVKVGQAIREAARSAAKVTFNNTTEAAAAANLVKTNKDRLASQPKAGSPTNRPAPKTKDDMYDRAFEEHIAPELAR